MKKILFIGATLALFSVAYITETSATPSSNQSCSSSSGFVSNFTFVISSDSYSMSEFGKFNAVTKDGSYQGIFFSQPQRENGEEFQGRIKMPFGAMEFLISLDGSKSKLFHRDITVMGPTVWVDQDFSCSPF